jgi:hypothetical protein
MQKGYGPPLMHDDFFVWVVFAYGQGAALVLLTVLHYQGQDGLRSVRYDMFLPTYHESWTRGFAASSVHLSPQKIILQHTRYYNDNNEVGLCINGLDIGMHTIPPCTNLILYMAT